MSRNVNLTAQEYEHAKRLGVGVAGFIYYRKDALVPPSGNSIESDPCAAPRKLLYEHGFYPQAWALQWDHEEGQKLIPLIPSAQAADLLEENGYSEEAAFFRQTRGYDA